MLKKCLDKAHFHLALFQLEYRFFLFGTFLFFTLGTFLRAMLKRWERTIKFPDSKFYAEFHENNVPSRLSPQWLCGNSCTWAHDVPLLQRYVNIFYVYMNIYLWSCKIVLLFLHISFLRNYTKAQTLLSYWDLIM